MQTGLAGRIAKMFITSKLTPLLMIIFVAIGVYSAYLTPSEEEPQIEVPIADIFIGYPGASPEEVEARVALPLEKVIGNIKGVEHVYSTSMNEQAMIIVQFHVGEDVERSIFKLYNEMMRHMDQMPKGTTPPLVKTRAIDDVPMLSLTLWSDRYDDYQLRRMAEELSSEVNKIPDIAMLKLMGGRSREVNITLDRDKMAAFGIDPTALMQQLQGSNMQASAGAFSQGGTEFNVRTGNFLSNAEQIENLVVGSAHGAPIYLRQVAAVEDGAELPSEYVSYGRGISHPDSARVMGSHPAVTLSIAKRKGADAMKLSEAVMAKVEALRPKLLPSDVHLEVTRDYGHTASEKVHELILHLIGSIVAVTILVALSMGWRGGLVVFLSVPITFALTLFVYYLFGYTLNRITLFALVFVTGIVVDDSIIIAENMHRHFKMRKLPLYQAAIAAIDEVGNPTILATFTVIAAVLPMIAVSGLMGPYMSPMPIGASMAMLFSLMAALVITPYLAYMLLRGEDHLEEKGYDLKQTGIYRFYERFMTPMMDSPAKRWGFIGGVTLMLLASMSLVYFKLVPVKMLPFDNKNEYQVIVDMPEGTPLENTRAVTEEIAAYLRKQPEVAAYQTYVGLSSPITFNGLMRHYDLRQGSHVADIQVNLTDKGDRSVPSHDLAKAVRPGVQAIGKKYGANVKVVEVPPGPPVISTLMAEIYGPDLQEQRKIAQQVMDVMRSTEGVVDVDWFVEDAQPEYHFEVDKEKAALAGVSTPQVVQALNIGLRGMDAGTLLQEREHTPVALNLRLSEQQRSDVEDLKRIQLRAMSGQMVSLGDVVKVQQRKLPSSIYHKDQKRVVYVAAEVAGNLEAPVYPILDMKEKIAAIQVPAGYGLEEFYAGSPELEEQFSLKWDGEWQITYEVFRDLGAAFAVVLVVIYMLIIAWFQDFKVPFVMMVSIPLSLVGILVGHWIAGAYFTATSMIGLIALAGIMVRNSILLIDFINLRMAEGGTLREAVIEAGAVRTTPILLTAGTVVIGAVVILFDPIFQGLAISLMGGTIASTVLTLLMVPIIYFMTEKDNPTISRSEEEIDFDHHQEQH